MLAVGGQWFMSCECHVISLLFLTFSLLSEKDKVTIKTLKARMD